jgi:hypothetical protein
MSWHWDASVLVLQCQVFQLDFIELNRLVVVAFLFDSLHLEERSLSLIIDLHLVINPLECLGFFVLRLLEQLGSVWTLPFAK